MKIREKLVTRTVTTLKVDVIGINSNDEMENRTFEIPEIEAKKILPYIAMNCDDFTPAKIKNVSEIETLYGMPESVFMKYAEKLPPRGSKEAYRIGKEREEKIFPFRFTRSRKEDEK